MRVFLFFFAFACMQTCKSSETEPEMAVGFTLEPCEKSEGWYIEKELENVAGTVIRSIEFPDVFQIAFDDAIPEKLAPCNLPESFRVVGTRVLVSGKALGNDKYDIMLPIELTSIELIEK